jgi:hypothetical protein
MSVKRIYIVSRIGSTEDERLIKASNPAQALRFATKSQLACRVADQGDLVKLVGEGVKVEEASETE